MCLSEPWRKSFVLSRQSNAYLKQLDQLVIKDPNDVSDFDANRVIFLAATQTIKPLDLICIAQYLYPL